MRGVIILHPRVVSELLLTGVMGAYKNTLSVDKNGKYHSNGCLVCKILLVFHCLIEQKHGRFFVRFGVAIDEFETYYGKEVSNECVDHVEIPKL